MNATQPLKAVRAQRPPEGIVRVRRKQGHAPRKAHHHRRMVKILRRAPELHEIAKLQPLERHFFRKRPVFGANPLAVANEKVVKILHPRPRRRAVVHGTVEPAHVGRVIHNANACEQALGREVGAIATDAVEIEIGRVARKRPFARVGNRRVSVIIDKPHNAEYAKVRKELTSLLEKEA